MNTPVIYIISFIALLNIILGILSIVKSKDKKPAYYFGGLILCSLLWSFFISLIEISSDSEKKLLFARLSFLGPIFLPVFLFNFIRFFPYRSVVFAHDSKAWLFNIVLIIIGILLNIIVIFSDSFISSALININNTHYTYGFMYIPFFILFATSIIALLYAFYKKYKNSDQFNKLKIKYVLAGFVFTITLSLFTNLLLPILGVDSLSSFGPVSTILLFGFTSYAIIFHRLFDIGTFVAKIVQYLIIGLVLFLTVFITRTIQYQIFNLSFYDPFYLFIDFIVCIIVGSFIKKVIEIVSRIVTQVMGNEKNDLYKMLKQIDSNIGQIFEWDAAVKKFLFLTKFYFPVSNVHFITKEKASYITTYVSKKTTINDQSFLKTISTITGTIISQENEDPKVIKFLKDNNLAIIGEIISDTYIIFENKSNDFPYTKLELDNIEILIEKLKSIFIRIQYYENIDNFNKLLKKKVDSQTKELQEAYNRLKLEDEGKNDILNIISHQLLTPISIIRGEIEELRDVTNNKTKKLEIVNTLAYQSKRSYEIVDEILRVSRVIQNGGVMTINKSRVNLIEVLKALIETFKPKAHNNGIKLSLDLPAKIKEVIVEVDKEKITEAISNMIDNAIIYTPKGSVTVSLEDYHASMDIIVKDTGIGIPQDKLHELFNKFIRLDNAKQIRPDGTGIGLYFIKLVVDAHGGKVDVSSEGEGKGSQFKIKLLKK